MIYFNYYYQLILEELLARVAPLSFLLMQIFHNAEGSESNLSQVFHI